jgi:hypothetical protein
VNKYLLVKGKGGMGNRMLCAITGILYGQLSGRQTIVDWRDGTYSSDGSNVFSRFFSKPEMCPETMLPKDGTVTPSIWTNELHKSMADMINEHDPTKHNSIFIHRKYSIDVSKMDYDSDIVVFWNYMHRIQILHSHLSDPKYGFVGLTVTQIIKNMLREHFILHNDIRQRIEDFKAKNWPETVIGLHIRYTDRRTNLKRYERPLRRFLQREPGAHIFLATDNHMVAQEYKKRFRNVFSTKKWFPDGISSMHQNLACRDKVKNGIEALIDMYLLADCDYLIYPSVSTFSWISYLLSQIPPEKVVDIDRFNLKVKLKRSIREFVA